MVKWKSPNEEASLIFCLVLRTNALCWAVLARYLKLLQKMRKYHIGELLTTTLRVQKVTVACRMWTFQVNFVLGICLLKCSDVLAKKFIFLIEIRAKKASNLPPGDHVTSRDNDVVLWTCCVTELIVSNALGENFLLSDCKHINVICMTKRPSKHDHEIGSHNKGLTWFLNLRENTPYGIKILWGFQTNPCLPGPPQTQLRNIKLTTLIPYIRGISAWGSVNKLQSVPMQKPILLLCSNSFFSSRSAHRTWRIKEGQIIKAVV